MKKKIIAFILLATVMALAVVAYKAYSEKDKYSLNENAIDRYSDFWDDPGKYDVWFMGSSHIYYSIYPMKLYEEYGITSYDIATPSSTLPMTYWTLMNALRKGTPEVVFIDAYHTDMDRPVITDVNKVHMMFDAMPLSLTKIRAIRDLVADKELRKELYIPVFEKEGKYKKELTVRESKQFKLNRGGRVESEIVGVEPKQSDSLLEEETLGMEYLTRIIEECKARDIDLVIAALPFNGKNIKLKGLNSALKLAEENSVPTFDKRICTDFINYGYEFSKDGHPNYSGAVKMTAVIGEFLTDEFDLKDHRASDPETGDSWDKDLERYRDYLEERMKEEEGLPNYLLYALDDKMFRTQIFIKDRSALGEYSSLIINGLDDKQVRPYEEAAEYIDGDTDCNTIVVVKDTSGEPVDTAYFE